MDADSWGANSRNKFKKFNRDELGQMSTEGREMAS